MSSLVFVKHTYSQITLYNYTHCLYFVVVSVVVNVLRTVDDLMSLLSGGAVPVTCGVVFL